jgi:hypothetical protein
MFGWLTALAYLGVLAGILARAKALYPGRAVRTLIVIEDPSQPLSITDAQVALAQYGATVVPGFSITP